MKYRGYEITKQMLPGSDFTVKESGKITKRKQSAKDVDHYYAEHIELGEILVNCSTIDEMKELIRLMNYLDKHACLPDGGSC